MKKLHALSLLCCGPTGVFLLKLWDMACAEGVVIPHNNQSNEMVLYTGPGKGETISKLEEMMLSMRNLRKVDYYRWN